MNFTPNCTLEYLATLLASLEHAESFAVLDKIHTLALDKDITATLVLNSLESGTPEFTFTEYRHNKLARLSSFSGTVHAIREAYDIPDYRSSKLSAHMYTTPVLVVDNLLGDVLHLGKFNAYEIAQALHLYGEDTRITNGRVNTSQKGDAACITFDVCPKLPWYTPHARTLQQHLHRFIGYTA